MTGTGPVNVGLTDPVRNPMVRDFFGKERDPDPSQRSVGRGIQAAASLTTDAYPPVLR